MNADEIFPKKDGEGLLDALDRAGGLYLRQTPEQPLVGYAGKSPNNGRQLVGEVYANMAQLEQWPHVLRQFQSMPSVRTALARHIDDVDVFCGLPVGGVVPAVIWALTYNRRFIQAEKKVTALPTETTREQSKLVLERHSVDPDERVALVEDVTNNFATTLQSIRMIEEAGGVVTLIITLFNRSPFFDVEYVLPDGRKIPIIAVESRVLPEYDDDDPRVAADVQSGNIVRKPKNQWAELMAKRRLGS